MAQSTFGRSNSGPEGTVIGPGLVIEGEITAEEDVTVAGRLKGRVATTGAVRVIDGGIAEADVEAASLKVDGTVAGNVAATERVELVAGGRLTGDVRTPRLSIAEGATFKGHIDMDA